MGIKSNFTPTAIVAYYDNVAKIISEETIRVLSYLGEKCVLRIRDRSAAESWIDHTGNLRSSIGYAVSDKGRIAIESQFNKVLEGSEGSAAGKKLVEELVSQYTRTYALIVVAGMSYAEYVEAIDTKDVLTSTELWADAQIDKYLQMAQSRIMKRVKALKL